MGKKKILFRATCRRRHSRRWFESLRRSFAADSGTFDYFTEAIVGKSKSSRGDFTASEDDNVLVQGVGRDKYALGYFGMAYYAENTKKMKAVPVVAAAGKPAVSPSVETVKNVSMEDLFQEDMFRILLTMFDKRNSVTNEYILEQLKPYREKTFTTIVMKNEALNQAQIAQKAIFDYEPRCSGALDHAKLCGEFLEIWRKRNTLPAKRPSLRGCL